MSGHSKWSDVRRKLGAPESMGPGPGVAASDRSSEPRCLCGTDAARAAGETVYVRTDIVCPKHDRPATTLDPGEAE